MSSQRANADGDGYAGEDGPVIDTQPRNKKSMSGQQIANAQAQAIRDYVTELEIETVEGWDAHAVVQNLLQILGLPHLGQHFLDHHITGPVLLHLDKDDLADITLGESNITIGERSYLHTIIEHLKTKRRRIDKSKVVWTVRTPEGPIQYYRNFCEFVSYRCCRCCMSHIQYELSGHGLEVIHQPPRCCFGCCRGFFKDNKDMRFLRDIDTHWHYGTFPCCWRRKYGVSMTFHDDSDEPSKNINLSELVVVFHPDIDDAAVGRMHDLWVQMRLVDS